VTAARAAPSTGDTRTVRWWTVALGVVVVGALAAWFRHRGLGASSLWFDDAWVAVGARFPSFGDTLRSGLTSPGFSVLYRGWGEVFGWSATTAQALPFTAGVLAPVLLFLAATERRVPWFAGLLGAGLLATAPAHMDMSSHLKQYTLEALATVVLLWLGWRVIDRPDATTRWVALGLVAVMAALLSSLGSVLGATVLGVGLLAALQHRPRRLAPALVTVAVFALVAAVWTVVVVSPGVHPKLRDYWNGFYLDGSGFAGGLGTRLAVVAHELQRADPTLVLLLLGAAAVLVLVRRPMLGVLLVAPTVAAVLLAAVRMVPLGTGRTDVYLLPSYALLVAVAVGELVTLVRGRARTAVAVGTMVVLVGAVAFAVPTPSRDKPCHHAVLAGTTLHRCPYPQENVTPLVHLAEQSRRPGDEIVVYSSTGFAYGLATRYPITRRSDRLSSTNWVVDVQGPGITVLRAHRRDPERWAGPVALIAARGDRVWVVGSHLFPDWNVLLKLMRAQGYRVDRRIKRPGAALLLYTRRHPQR
jgi:hypothetical protein